MASGVWSGHLNLSLLSIPVRLIPAARSEGISFNMLHRDDLSRLKQQYVCLVDNQIVSRDEVVKGYEFRKNEYVVVEPQEITEISPQTTETMNILEFVQASEVDSIYFDSSYYIKPEDAGKNAYALLTKAMQNGSFYGVAKVAMHNREYTVIIRPYKGILLLHTMFYSNEVRDPEFKVEVVPKDKEVEMGVMLISSMADDFTPEKYSDSFQEALQELIKGKIEGTPFVKKEKTTKKSAVPDILEALKLSMAQINEDKATKKKNGNGGKK